MKTSIDELSDLAGQELGQSEWLVVEQRNIDQFAEATYDRQWIHVDTERAAQGPFGTTIAHGYLALALIVPLVAQVLEVSDAAMGVNYGLNKVRFPAPLPSGASVRITAVLASGRLIENGVEATIQATLTSDQVTKPVCVAEVIFRFYR